MDSSFAIIIVLLLSMMLVWILFLVIRKDHTYFENETFKQKYSSLIEGVKVKKDSKMPMLYNFLIVVRRLIFAMSSIFLGRH